VQKSLTAIKSSNKSPSLHKYLRPFIFPQGRCPFLSSNNFVQFFIFRHSSTRRIGRVFGKVFMQCTRPRWTSTYTGSLTFLSKASQWLYLTLVMLKSKLEVLILY
jgi:hypothetical protein